MSTPANSTNSFRATIIRQQVEKISERVSYHAVKSQYGDDQRALATMLQQAENIYDAALQGRILNVMGLLHRAHGRLQLALDHYEQSYNVLATVPDPLGQLNSLYNRGGLYIALADYDTAVRFLEVTLDMLALINPPPEDIVTRKLTYMSAMVLALTLKGDYSHAAEVIEQFWTIFHEDSTAPLKGFGATMTIVRRCNASIQLMQGDTAGAWNEIRLLLENSIQTDAHSDIAAGILIKAMIGLCDPSLGISVEQCRHEIDSFVDTRIAAMDTTLWYIANHSFMECAREFHAIGNREWAVYCARRAVEILTLLEDVERKPVAENLLEQLEMA